MPLVKISTGGSGKNAIFVDGGILSYSLPIGRRLTELLRKGIHAREWISPAFVTWLIHELVENYDAHPQYVDNIDW